MRWSQSFIPTLREEPAGVEAISHKLLVRAGYIRQLTAGVYSLLPLAQRVRLKVMQIIREEMNLIGGQEFALSALQPLELWEESGRLDAVSEIMFRLKDRKRSELALGLTHEEVFTTIARSSLNSYKQLPQIWYQIQTKFRDEARPKAGLLRVREFTMKDAYSFDFDQAGLDVAFQKHHDAYVNIFTRCGLDFRAVQANSGAMGGSASTEFMAITPAGEDTLVLCSGCDYAANQERAESVVQKHEGGDDACGPMQEISTPGVRTIKELEEFHGGGSAQRQIKTLVYVVPEGLVLALVRGDQELNEVKLQAALKAPTIRQATEEEIVVALGAKPGSLGACSVKAGAEHKIKKIVADTRLKGRSNMLTGANKDDVHYNNVTVDRDIAVHEFLDLHTAKTGESCIKCGGALTLTKGLEIGHIFKLGTRYSEIMNAHVLGADGAQVPIVMGSYGIGVERLMAAVAELSNDEKGLIWPSSIAPYQVVIVCVNVKDDVQVKLAEDLYSQLNELGIDTLLDDRDERAGVKFNDCELIGVPVRITVGKKASSGVVEVVDRKTKKMDEIAIGELVDAVSSMLSEES
jgi:prolyl-tRNA synthetase